MEEERRKERSGRGRRLEGTKGNSSFFFVFSVFLCFALPFPLSVPPLEGEIAAWICREHKHLLTLARTATGPEARDDLREETAEEADLRSDAPPVANADLAPTRAARGAAAAEARAGVACRW